jgi:hypothetical protein
LGFLKNEIYFFKNHSKKKKTMLGLLLQAEEGAGPRVAGVGAGLFVLILFTVLLVLAVCVGRCTRSPAGPIGAAAAAWLVVFLVVMFAPREGADGGTARKTDGVEVLRCSGQMGEGRGLEGIGGEGGTGGLAAWLGAAWGVLGWGCWGCVLLRLNWGCWDCICLAPPRVSLGLSGLLVVVVVVVMVDLDRAVSLRGRSIDDGYIFFFFLVLFFPRFFFFFFFFFYSS